MSSRVTRSCAARNAAPSTTNDLDQHHPSAASSKQHQASFSASNSSPTVSAPLRKRKAAALEESSTELVPIQQRKRPRGGDSDQASARSLGTPRRRKRTSSNANMSDNLPSSSNSADTSPQSAPKDALRKRSHRRKSKEESASSVTPAISRKSKRGSKKDFDAIMKETEDKIAGHATTTEDEPAKHDSGASAGADGSHEGRGLRRFTEGLMERSGTDDPFAGGYLSRLVGQAGLAGLSGHLRAISGMTSSTGNRLRTMLEQLRVKDDPSIQLIALQELSELLLVSNEDNLAGQFAPDQLVKELVALMQPNEFTGEENPEIMLLACRCIANLMEALPASTSSVVYGGAVPILCQKLLEIHFIDLAEQALSTLEKISQEFPSSIVREGGLTACLTYLEFFATSTQRTAVTTAANCCRNIPEDSFSTVRDVMPILLNTLSSNDQRVVEQASLCVSRIIDSFKYNDAKLEELVSTDLLRAIQRLLLPGSTNMISPGIHTSFLRVLSITARASPRLSVELLKMDVVDTLYQILTGVSAPSQAEGDLPAKIDKNIIMQAIIRTPREQVFETLNVVCEILPTMSREDLLFLEDLNDAGYTGKAPISMSTRSKKSPNEKRLELLKDCPAQVERFAVILFPTLMHAYTSTVNLQVRQKVLTAQLKMLSNFDTAILEKAMKGVLYASHLASILSQQDNPALITYALQAAELLLKRLGTLYKPRFVREGVIAEILSLAQRPIKTVSEPVQHGSHDETNAKLDAKPLAEQTTHEHEEDVMDLDVDDIIEEHDEIIDQAEEEDENEGEHVNEDGEHEEIIEDELDEEHDDENEYSDESDPASESTTSHQSKIADTQDVITLRAKRFIEVHGSLSNDTKDGYTSSILDDLHKLAQQLQTESSRQSNKQTIEVLEGLAKYFDGTSSNNITSFELMTSGVVDALLNKLNDADGPTRKVARTSFAEVFMSARGSSSASDIQPTTPFSILLHKLQELLSRSEQFEVVTVNQNAYEANRAGAASMLAKQLRLQLVADDDSGIPKPYRRIQVSIHAIATFQALDDYLRPRISLADRSRGGGHDHVSHAMAAYASMVGKDKTGLPPPLPAMPSLSSSLPTRSSAKHEDPDHYTPKNDEEEQKTPHERKSLRRSSRRHSALLDAMPKAPVADRSAQTPTPKGTRDALECPDETQIPDDDDDDLEAEFDALVDEMEDQEYENEEAEPAPVNMEVGNSGKVTARTDDGTRVSTPSQHGTPTPAANRDRMMQAHARLAAAREVLGAPGAGSSSRSMSYSSALQQPPQDWHIEFSINGRTLANDTTIYRACHNEQIQQDGFAGRNVWSTTHTISYKRVEGPAIKGSALSTLSGGSQSSDKSDLPLSLTQHPNTARILRLMSILHDLNSRIDETSMEGAAQATLVTEPLPQFVNTKLTAKLNRQLEEPLIVASNCLPSWSEDLARLYPFLFPFETRHLFLSSTSFGYSRSMSRWQSSQADEGRRSRHHRDERPFLGRLQRQKVRVSRHRILESAIKVMDMYGTTPSLLEVEYFEEVGTGLGPTLEFYSTCSREFSKKKIKLWRENESSSTGDYAFGRHGLFPAPMTEQSCATETGQKVLHLFKALGKFVARSMLDSRIIDISFNPAFFRVDNGLDHTVASVASVDRDLARSLKMLSRYADAKERIEKDDKLDQSSKARALADIRINDAKLEDLALDFTLPGYDKIELLPGGADHAVNLDNVARYIDLVIDFTLGAGVCRQIEAFASGFNAVFPYEALKAFTPDELVMLFGRVKEDWSLETLMDSIKADHGYNLDSKSVRNLLQVMSRMSDEEKRGFLQFVTGSPKLPIGGFKSLTPMFTVVCKPADSPLTSDDYLPSVMTCANYLKMPDYSTIEVLKEKLGLAMREGQGSFHLS